MGLCLKLPLFSTRSGAGTMNPSRFNLPANLCCFLLYARPRKSQNFVHSPIEWNQDLTRLACEGIPGLLLPLVQEN